jgi:hypothetical protein
LFFLPLQMFEQHWPLFAQEPPTLTQPNRLRFGFCFFDFFPFVPFFSLAAPAEGTPV